MKRAVVLFSILVGLALSTSSCAFIDQRVSLKYISEGGGAVSSVEEPVTLLTVVNVEAKLDKKGDSYVIGNVKNGWGMTTADTITTDRLDDWIVGALAAELTSRGIKVERASQFPATFDAGASLIVKRVWVNQDLGFWTVGAITQINVLADLYSKGELVKKVAIEGTGDSRSVLSTYNEREESLQKALRAVMAQLVPEILVLRK